MQHIQECMWWSERCVNFSLKDNTFSSSNRYTSLLSTFNLIRIFPRNQVVGASTDQMTHYSEI